MLNTFILTVDDDPEFLDIVTAKLKSRGYAFDTAKDGNEALAKARSLHPVLILMDVDMPNKDGIETTIELQGDAATRDIKIIFLTNLGDASPSVATINKRFSQQIGAVDYFKKGGDWEVLFEKIKTLIAS